MQAFIALLLGLLFGAGLTVSQMIDPAKVLAFLDVGAIPSNGWDPSLAFVMIGALIVTAPLYWYAQRRQRPIFAETMQVPSRRDLDTSLMVGAMLFGAGWGLAGYCPGPALAGLAFGAPQTVVFVVAMIAGMLIHKATREQRA